MLSIISVVFNNLEITRRFLSSIRQYTQGGYELILIDNGSTDNKTISFIEKSADNYYRFEKKTDLAKAWNKGIEITNGKYVAIVNNDVIVPPNWFLFLKETLDNNMKAGMVSPITYWLIKDGMFKYNLFSNFDKSFSIPYKLEKFKEVVWGEFCVFKRQALIEVGGYNEIYKDISAEDLEICFQLFSKDYDIYIDPRVFVYHEGNATINLMKKEEINNIYERNFKLFKERWKKYAGDWK